MTGLILRPSFDEHNREEIEAYIETVRARRMVAAIEYEANSRLRIQHESERVQKRVNAAQERLHRRIEVLDGALHKVEEALTELEILRQEYMLDEEGDVVVSESNTNEESDDEAE